MSESISGLSASLIGLVGALLVVAEVISQVTGSYWHWVPIAFGIVVGLVAVRAILR